jgi:hypothetical protein
MGRKSRRKAEPKFLKLDLGCGQNKRDGFIGVDVSKEAKPDQNVNLFVFPWPWKNESVEEIHCSHFFEHVPALIRFPFMDECYRILAPNGRVTLISPCWTSSRAIQDPTHQWPPLAPASFLYFNKRWREDNKLTHYPVRCDFDFGFSYSISPTYLGRSQDFLQASVETMLNVAMDLQVVLTKREEESK